MRLESTLHILLQKIAIKGIFDDSSGNAFRILAGYIFGKNKGKTIAMTSPVEIKQSPIKFQ